MELDRMARERRWQHALWSGMCVVMTVVSASNIVLFLHLRTEMWPVWVEAMSMIPGSAVFHWNVALILFSVGILAGSYGAVGLWKTRQLPETDEYIILAIQRLTARGGL